MDNSGPRFRKHDVDFTPTQISRKFYEKGKSLRADGDLEACNENLILSIQMDRQNLAAYEELIELYTHLDQGESLRIIRSEKSRIEGSYLAPSNPVSDYEKTLDKLTNLGGKSPRPKQILVVTNLFPPQEMGGFGKTMWEFCYGLMQKGHRLTVLTADASYLYQKPPAGWPDIESSVVRCLQLYGHWKTGITQVESDPTQVYAVAEQNLKTIRKYVDAIKPDACLVGNIDLLGHPFLYEMDVKGIPVIHRLGNKLPGYPVEHTPKSPRYCMAPCSQWLKESLLSQGYSIKRFEVLSPGSPLEHYFRFIAPDFSGLRIAYASIVAPFKGLHVLMDALAILKRSNVPFECHVLGNATDQAYLNRILSRCEEADLMEDVWFYGFQSRKATARIFDRCNTLVFPSTFEEPFGKTQIEAMAAGMAVVCSGTGGSSEIVRDGETGLVFNNKDPVDLAEKLIYLANHPSFAFELAQAGQVHCLQYSTANSVKRLDAIIEKMVTGSAPT